MKKIIVLGPVMPLATDIEAIASTLTFLRRDYQIDFIDPLSIQAEVSNESYYDLWKNVLKKYLENYDVFFGFSFGGVILEQCFDLFLNHAKPIVLFSTPTFADEDLAKKLGQVIRFCKENELLTALEQLYSDVFSPYQAPKQSLNPLKKELIASRLIFGLERVLASDSSRILRESTLNYLHLVGECSNLVNTKNVLNPHKGRLVIVPGAGMRVLQDNPAFCQKIILDYLGSETL
ncbi:MAG: hypothetical protein H0U57_04730 [Tatlockia sp.]|nr:hypothetical protein [Tatlockia sp.]